MKKLLTIIMLLTVVTAYTQTSMQKTLVTESSFKVYERIRGEDTMVYYYMSYQNQKYQHITDLGSILLNQKEDVEELANGLKKLAEHEEKVSIIIHNKYFEIAIYEFSNNVYLMDSNGKYTTFTKKQAIKLSEALLLHTGLLRH
jgi:hypothetical protein